MSNNKNTSVSLNENLLDAIDQLSFDLTHVDTNASLTNIANQCLKLLQKLTFKDTKRTITIHKIIPDVEDKMKRVVSKGEYPFAHDNASEYQDIRLGLIGKAIDAKGFTIQKMWQKKAKHM